MGFRLVSAVDPTLESVVRDLVSQRMLAKATTAATAGFVATMTPRQPGVTFTWTPDTSESVSVTAQAVNLHFIAGTSTGSTLAAVVAADADAADRAVLTGSGTVDAGYTGETFTLYESDVLPPVALHGNYRGTFVPVLVNAEGQLQVAITATVDLDYATHGAAVKADGPQLMLDSTAAPTPVTSGQAVRARADLNGDAFAVTLGSEDGTTVLAKLHPIKIAADGTVAISDAVLDAVVATHNTDAAPAEVAQVGGMAVDPASLPADYTAGKLVRVSTDLKGRVIVASDLAANFNVTEASAADSKTALQLIDDAVVATDAAAAAKNMQSGRVAYADPSTLPADVSADGDSVPAAASRKGESYSYKSRLDFGEDPARNVRRVEQQPDSANNPECATANATLAAAGIGGRIYGLIWQIDTAFGASITIRTGSYTGTVLKTLVWAIGDDSCGSIDFFGLPYTDGLFYVYVSGTISAQVLFRND